MSTIRVWFTCVSDDSLHCDCSNCSAVSQAGGYWSAGTYECQFTSASRVSAMLAALKRYPDRTLAFDPRERSIWDMYYPPGPRPFPNEVLIMSIRVWFTRFSDDSLYCDCSAICRAGGYWSAGTYEVEFTSASRVTAMLVALKRYPDRALVFDSRERSI